jgi:hypothetical protein
MLAVSVSLGGVAAAAIAVGRHGPQVVKHTSAKRTMPRERTASIGGLGLSSGAIAQITSDANWIVANQFSNGAIAQGITPTSSTSVFIEPFTANYAAIGLARSAAATGERGLRPSELGVAQVVREQ